MVRGDCHMKFTKVHGLGNDFIIVNALEEHIDDLNLPAAAVKLCDRHFGIGADGLVLVRPSERADFRMQIFNSDGSEAEMCGNVTRCFARFVYENGLTAKTQLTLETLAGIIKPQLIFDNHGAVAAVRVDMGEPRLRRQDIPMIGPASERAVSVPLAAGGQNFAITAVSMGNPHCVIFVPDVAAIPLETWGPAVETHAAFPRKTNVEFVQVLNRQEMRMRVWERGAGITLACGTGTCATLVAAVLTGRADKQAVVHLDGGDLHIAWGDDNHVYMTGPTAVVFNGEYLDTL